MIVFTQSRYRSAMRDSLILILAAVLLAGCGYKGPLYLPGSKTESTPEAKKPAAKPAPQPEEKKPDPS
jgi:predicted small lipoprotein YifL